jgi:pSer/pThr/pTyr-binding forkhead associated (FHA) protein
MKITFESHEVQQISSLKPGEVFRFGDDIHIVTNAKSEGQPEMVHAVELEDGYCKTFLPTADVEVLKVQLSVYK